MEVVSINVGLPMELIWKGKPITTAIYKEQVSGKVKVRSLGLEGDRQADLTVHGGIDKAIYAYASEHYTYWRNQLPEMEFNWGMFGENLTVEGLLENNVNIGDRFRIGTAEIMVTEPRMPCYKIVIRFGRSDMAKRLLNSRRTGIYFSVIKEGEIEAGERLELISRDENNVKVSDIVRLYVRETNDLELLQRTLQVQALPNGWRDYFQLQLEKVKS